ncbi:ABC transporter permease [Microbacterium sp.]|uniref:ABC transporter permease n=1 Tax=Microbacterium sp. TaxID=51671 RepID=UPI003A8B7B28
MSALPADLSEYDVPGRGRGILDVFRRRYLLKLLVQKGTALRYRNSVLGWIWSYVRPTIQFFVYFFVVGHVLGQNGRVEDYPLYLFSGIVVVNLFNEAFGHATRSIVSNKSLVRKIYLPRELFPISAVIGSFIHFLPQLAILLIVAVVFGWVPTWLSVLSLLAGLALILAFSTGIGVMASAFNVRFRDAQNFVEIVRTIATWSAPVLYTWVLLEDKVPFWFYGAWASSPLTVSVELFHQAVWGPTVTENIGLPPEFPVFAGAAVAFTLVCLVLGQVVFRSFERSFAQDL